MFERKLAPNSTSQSPRKNSPAVVTSVNRFCEKNESRIIANIPEKNRTEKLTNIC
jgi:hypothetical protein